MEIFTKLYIFISAILIALFNSDHAKARKQASAFITQVQSVPSGSSSVIIACAFQLMKSSSNSHMRIAEGSDNCEQLTRTEVIRSPFKQGFEYFEKSTLLTTYDPPVRQCSVIS